MQSQLYAELLQWEITGQVRDFEDPDNVYIGEGKLLGDIRNGDAVRGLVYYDTEMMDYEDEFEGSYYESDTSRPGAVLIIENARDGTELEFAASAEDADFLFHTAEVYNDYYYEDLGETSMNLSLITT